MDSLLSGHNKTPYLTALIQLRIGSDSHKVQHNINLYLDIFSPGSMCSAVLCCGQCGTGSSCTPRVLPSSAVSIIPRLLHAHSFIHHRSYKGPTQDKQLTTLLNNTQLKYSFCGSCLYVRFQGISSAFRSY